MRGCGSGSWGTTETSVQGGRARSDRCAHRARRDERVGVRRRAETRPASRQARSSAATTATGSTTATDLCPAATTAAGRLPRASVRPDRSPDPGRPASSGPGQSCAQGEGTAPEETEEAAPGRRGQARNEGSRTSDCPQTRPSAANLCYFRFAETPWRSHLRPQLRQPRCADRCGHDALGGPRRRSRARLQVADVRSARGAPRSLCIRRRHGPAQRRGLFRADRIEVAA